MEITLRITIPQRYWLDYWWTCVEVKMVCQTCVLHVKQSPHGCASSFHQRQQTAWFMGWGDGWWGCSWRWQRRWCWWPIQRFLVLYNIPYLLLPFFCVDKPVCIFIYLLCNFSEHVVCKDTSSICDVHIFPRTFLLILYNGQIIWNELWSRLKLTFCAQKDRTYSITKLNIKS